MNFEKGEPKRFQVGEETVQTPALEGLQFPRNHIRCGLAGAPRYLSMMQINSIHGKLLGVLQEVDLCLARGHAPEEEKRRLWAVAQAQAAANQL